MTTKMGAVRLLVALTLTASGLPATGAFAQAGKPAGAPSTAPQAGKPADKPALPTGTTKQPVTAAPTIDPAKEKSIRELLEASGEAKRLGSLIGEQIFTYFQRSAPGGIPADKTDAVKARFTDISELTTAFVGLYDKRYTTDEIIALTAFYRTPVGKKLAEQSLSYGDDLRRISQAWGNPRAEAISGELRSTQQPPSTPTNPATQPAGATFDKKPFKSSGKVVKTASGLQYDDMTVGTGKVAVAGKTCIMHYTGTLKDGTKFDSSTLR